MTGAAVVAVFDKFEMCLSGRMGLLLGGAFLLPARLLPQPWERFCCETLCWSLGAFGILALVYFVIKVVR